MTRAKSSSLASKETDRFSALSEEWWKPNGALHMLHKLNPLRGAYIEKQVCHIFGRKTSSRLPYKGLRVLDVGCGGGLLAESMAKFGALVTGIDSSQKSIDAARRHADVSGLVIDYRVINVEDFVPQTRRYDLITAMEIVEHVDNIEIFLQALMRHLKPNGLLILSTLNRTLRSLLFGVIAAEYLLDWVPRGAHDWTKFRRPSELVKQLELQGLKTINLSGVVFDPFSGEFRLDEHNLSINYILVARRR